MRAEVIGALLSDYAYSRTSANRQLNITSIFPNAALTVVSDHPDTGFYAEAWKIDGTVWVAFRGTTSVAADRPGADRSRDRAAGNDADHHLGVERDERRCGRARHARAARGVFPGAELRRVGRSVRAHHRRAA